MLVWGVSRRKRGANSAAGLGVVEDAARPRRASNCGWDDLSASICHCRERGMLCQRQTERGGAGSAIERDQARAGFRECSTFPSASFWRRSLTSARSGRSSRNARFKREDDRASFCAANEVETFCADGKKTRLPVIGWVRMRKGGANLRCCPQSGHGRD